MYCILEAENNLKFNTFKSIYEKNLNIPVPNSHAFARGLWAEQTNLRNN